MASILVLGGSRFIGKHVLIKLAEKNHNITVLNRGTVPEEKYLPDNAEHFAVDRNDADKMRDILENKEFDIVYDISCITKKHAEIVLDILEGKVKRHVHVSSGAVYDLDNVLTLPIEEDFQYPEIKEDTHPYVRDKTQAEQVLLDGYRNKKYPVTIIRPTFVYGPDNYVYREAYFFDRISRDRPILLPEKGLGSFDLVHVDDLADMILLLGESDPGKVVGESFNASSGFFVSGNMYTRLVAKILGKRENIVYYPLSIGKEFDWPPEKPLFPYIPEITFTMSPLKIERILGFRSKFSYEAGLKNAFDWWKNQENPEPEFSIEDSLIKFLGIKNKKDSSESEINIAHDELQAEVNKIKKEVEDMKKKSQESKSVA